MSFFSHILPTFAQLKTKVETQKHKVVGIVIDIYRYFLIKNIQRDTGFYSFDDGISRPKVKIEPGAAEPSQYRTHLTETAPYR